jgi:hypothetical protein
VHQVCAAHDVNVALLVQEGRNRLRRPRPAPIAGPRLDQ